MKIKIFTIQLLLISQVFLHYRRLEEPEKSQEEQTQQIDEIEEEEQQEEMDENQKNQRVIDEELEASEALFQETKQVEEYFKECLNKYEPFDWNQENIEKCIEVDFNKVNNACKLVRLRFLSKKDDSIKQSFASICYQDAGEDQMLLETCNILEQDILTFLWDELDVIEIIDANRVKYLEELGLLEQETYQNQMGDIKTKLNDHLTDLQKLDSYRENTILNLENFIAQKTEEFLKHAIKEDNQESINILESINVKITDKIYDSPDVERKLPEIKISKNIVDHLLYDSKKDIQNFDKRFNISNKQRQKYDLRKLNLHENLKGINPHWDVKQKMRFLLRENLIHQKIENQKQTIKRKKKFQYNKQINLQNE